MRKMLTEMTLSNTADKIFDALEVLMKSSRGSQDHEALGTEPNVIFGKLGKFIVL